MWHDTLISVLHLHIIDTWAFSRTSVVYCTSRHRPTGKSKTLVDLFSVTKQTMAATNGGKCDHDPACSTNKAVPNDARPCFKHVISYRLRACCSSSLAHMLDHLIHSHRADVDVKQHPRDWRHRYTPRRTDIAPAAILLPPPAPPNVYL